MRQLRSEMCESGRWLADLVCLGQVKTKHAADEAAAAAALNMTLLGQVLFSAITVHGNHALTVPCGCTPTCRSETLFPLPQVRGLKKTVAKYEGQLGRRLIQLEDEDYDGMAPRPSRAREKDDDSAGSRRVSSMDPMPLGGRDEVSEQTMIDETSLQVAVAQRERDKAQKRRVRERLMERVWERESGHERVGEPATEKQRGDQRRSPSHERGVSRDRSPRSKLVDAHKYKLYMSVAGAAGKRIGGSLGAATSPLGPIRKIARDI